MPDHITLTNGAMDALRRKYAVRLREREAQIQALIDIAMKQALTDEERYTLQNHAHSLAGSGATYGYPDISKHGRALEEAVEKGLTEAMLVPMAWMLVNVCRSISSTQMPPPMEGAPVVQREVPTEKKKKNLLIIDDDQSVHEIIRELMKNEVAMLHALDGHQGLEMIRSRKPDLVLLDGSMPGMKGMTLLESLAADPELKKTNVVMLTAHNQNSYVGKAIMTGALGYIVKPFDPPKLAARLRGLLQRLDTTILIADDDASIQDLLWHKFHATGINILQATDGETALALAQQYKPTLAIIDWMMPGLDGLALLHKIKQDPKTKDTKVVMLTVKHQEQDILEGLKFGAADYIVKPFITEEVVLRCFRLLGFNTQDES